MTMLRVNKIIDLMKMCKFSSNTTTSNDLKEALWEKIPLHYDLVRNFRENHGRSVVSSVTLNDIYEGLTGLDVIVKETCEIHPKFGVNSTV